MALTYLKKYKKYINLEIQDTAIINPENVNEQDLNGFLLYRMAHYKDSKYDDTALWECIREDFIKQIKEIQAPTKKNIMQDFYDFLQENGVFVPKDRGAIRDNIQEQVIDAKEKHKQTPQEIEYQLYTIKKFNL